MNAFVLPSCVLYRSVCSVSLQQRRPKHVAMRCSRHRRNKIPVSCRMRNRGGFRLPPRVPSDSIELQRAIALLGNMTQRRNMKTAVNEEIERLIGAQPETKEIAQKWKNALQRQINPRKQHLKQPGTFRNRKRLLEAIRLPRENGSVGRCFVLLGCLSRRYSLSQPASLHVVDELTTMLGSAPSNERETHHYIKTLVFLQKERRTSELRPPCIPIENMDDLEFARMVLGTYAVRGSIGKQTQRLEQILGTLPRNTNIATSWKKVIEASIRKIKRRSRGKQKIQALALQRLQRRLRRQEKEGSLASMPSESTESLNELGTVDAVLCELPQVSAVTSTAAVPTNTAFFGRIRGFFDRILPFRH